jgi:hypothetical protein
MAHRHWRTGDLYEVTDDGTVRVERPDGTIGVFHPDGRWSSGELKWADIHMIEFVVGMASAQAATR